MAQLTWRNVDAPQGSIRDLALAGQQITGAFDRFGQMLADRETRLRKDATDAQVAQAYMAGTPEEIAAIRARGLEGLDRRVDRAAYARALGEAENDIVTRSVNREELLGLQANAQMGDEQAHYLSLLGQGDRAGAAAYAAEQARLNPDMWSRVAYGTQKEGETVFDNYDTRRMTGERDAETARSNRADEANARTQTAIQGQRLALEKRSIALQEQQREQALAAATAGRNMARNPDMDRATAMKWAADNLSPTQQDQFASSFDGYLKTYAGLSPDQQNQVTAANAPLVQAKDALAGKRAAAVAANRANRPDIDAVERYRNDPSYAKMKPEDAIAALDGNINLFTATGGVLNPASWGGADGLYRQLRAEGLSPGEIVAGLDSGYGGRGFWTNFFTATGGRSAIRKMAQQIKAAKKPGGYDQFVREEAANVTAGFDEDIQRIDQEMQRTAERVGRTSQVQSRTEGGRTVITTTPAKVDSQRTRNALDRVLERLESQSGYIRR